MVYLEGYSGYLKAKKPFQKVIILWKMVFLKFQKSIKRQNGNGKSQNGNGRKYPTKNPMKRGENSRKRFFPKVLQILKLETPNEATIPNESS